MPVQFKLSNIEVPQFAILTEEPFSNPMNIDYKFEFSVNEETSSIRCDANIIYVDDNITVMKLVVRCDFNIEANSWKGLTKDGEIVFPANFLQHLAALTVGSARGIYYGKTEGTKYNQFFIPLLDVTKAIKEDMVIARG